MNTIFQKPMFDLRIPAQGLAQGAIWIEEPIYYLTGGLQTAGAAVEQFGREVARASIPKLMEEAASAGEAISLFLPHLIRSLTPHPDAKAAGAFIGIDDPRGPVQGSFGRAAFEARAVADAMVASAGLPPFETILTIGTTLQNWLLAQIKADRPHPIPGKRAAPKLPVSRTALMVTNDGLSTQDRRDAGEVPQLPLTGCRVGNFCARMRQVAQDRARRAALMGGCL